MYQKTVEREESYSKEQIAKIKKALAGLKEFRKSPSVMAYLKKRRLELKGKAD